MKANELETSLSVGWILYARYLTTLEQANIAL